ncbi:ABC transporter permease [Falsiroseomonas sp. HW251]|uniref:ABC transporter permease n=1 Tax=Falsiroseomonas sp. HW251 TaxID=3390998 RepID=UPI003D311A71
MARYVLRRIGLMVPTLGLVLLVVFVVLRITGDPVELFLDVNATPQDVAALRERLGLDQPLPLQFLRFVWDLLHGDFGLSLSHQQPALPVVLERVGATLELVSVALLIAVVLGVSGGLVAASLKDRLADHVVSALAVLGQSMPSFWLGLLLIQAFALELGWLPTSGSGTPAHLVLPAVTLSAYLLPNFILVTRSAVLEAKREPFSTTARAKGVGPLGVLLRHVLPNALNPIITLLGLQIGHLIAGSIVTETIFAWPGIGRLMIGSIYQRDVPIVAAGVVIVSLVIMVTNLLVDVVQALLDPRVRV